MEIFPRYWPFIRGIHRSPVNSPHKGQWRGALMFSLICARTNDWVNNREAGALRRHRAHYDVTVIIPDVFAFAGAMASTQRTGIRVHICLQMSQPQQCHGINRHSADWEVRHVFEWTQFTSLKAWLLSYRHCVYWGWCFNYVFILTTRKKMRR